MIVADDVGFGDLSVPQHATPHLDGLARSGMSAEHFYSLSPVCSRATHMVHCHTFH